MHSSTIREAEYCYLNLKGEWEGFQLHGTEIHPDGSLILARVPALIKTIGQCQTGVQGISEPAGVTSDSEGNIFISDPVHHQIIHTDICSGIMELIPCFGGLGALPGQLNAPRGLLAGPRGALYITDSGNHRIQVLDIKTGQLRGIWGQPFTCDICEPSFVSGRFNEPWDLVSDSQCNFYVVERAGARVQKFDVNGQADPSFWDNLNKSLTGLGLVCPTNIAVGQYKGGEALFLLDPGQLQVLIFRCDGYFEVNWNIPTTIEPVGIAIVESAVYIGDARNGQLIKFNLEGCLIGSAHGYHGSIAGLGVYGKDYLLLNSGKNCCVSIFKINGAFLENGYFMVGPLDRGGMYKAWSRFDAWVKPLPDHTCFRFFTLTGEQPIDLGRSQEKPFVDQEWFSYPVNETQGLIINNQAYYLWIGGVFQGNGLGTPHMVQFQVSDPAGHYLDYLPAIYKEDDVGRILLEKILALFESSLKGIEGEINSLPLLFDPFTAPTRWVPWLVGWNRSTDNEFFTPNWLQWLTKWLALDLGEDLPESKSRHIIADAFSLYGMRGTLPGLRRLIKEYTNLDVIIEEPGLVNGIWSLDNVSLLGCNTMLAPNTIHNAFFESNALVEGCEKPTTIVNDVTYHFCVLVYQSELRSPCTLSRIRSLLDQEKPAHTDYELCVIKPLYRIGLQARIGVDAIFAGPQLGSILDTDQLLGSETILIDENAAIKGQIGNHSHLGKDTYFS